jgi:UDP-N-acetylmuramoyl-tripeptide--D-alanyl-D-alanine ligase
MMLLSEAASAINAKLTGADVMLSTVSTDSRKIASGQLFVALKGEKFDGHDFARQAIEQGAAAVLLSKSVDGAEPALLVEDTYLALGELAAYWRSKFTLPVVAITGSNGKTTVKEMLATILRAATGNAENVLATQGN